MLIKPKNRAIERRRNAKKTKEAVFFPRLS